MFAHKENLTYHHLRAGCCVLLLLIHGLCKGQETVDLNNCQPPLKPFTEELQKQWQAAGFKIGEITIGINPIFDQNQPDEDTALARWTNRFHIQTKPHVIKRQLLFQTGDPFSIDLLQESERLIRANDFFYDAKITATAVCGDQINVLVEARDLWTLIPDLDYKSSGGDTSSRLGFRDSNFLGLGKQVVVVHKSDENRSGLSMTYTDPNLFGSRYRLRLQHENNDDGDLSVLRLGQPFYAFSTPWSSSLNFLQHEREEDLYFRNDETQTFIQDERAFSASYGQAYATTTSRTHRWLVGYTSEDNKFTNSPETVATEPLPADRKYAYPWLAWQLLDNNFSELININQLNRTEDLNIGWDVFLRLGHASDGTGSDDEGWVFDGYVRRNYNWAVGRILSLEAEFSGIESDEGLLNFNTTMNSRYYHSWSDKHQLYAALSLSKSHRQFTDQQLLLGGDTGLRGYPSRYQSGDRSFLLTLEHRIHFNHELWQLFDTGAVIFADVGRAWFKDQDNGLNGGVLKDIGIGLRLSPTRAGKDVVLHLDIGFPLDTDDPDLDDVQINFEAKRRF